MVGDSMFVILVYDFEQKRVAKALRIARKYLYWVQNSVFEGEITKSNYFKLKKELEAIMNPDTDSIVFYLFRTRQYIEREEMGLKKGGEENIL